MSANHTYVSADELFADAKEMERLRSGNIEEMRKAERDARQMMELMRQSGRTVLNSLSQDRKDVIKAFQEAEDQMLMAMNSVQNNAESAQRRTQALNNAVRQANEMASRILDGFKTEDRTAVELYQEARRQYSLSQADIMYRRFAYDQMKAIELRLQKMGEHDSQGDALQIAALKVLTDIYHMDIDVARQKAEYDVMYAEAASLGTQLRAYCRNIRENNREEIGDDSTALLDVDFWSDGRFSQLEQQLEEIMHRLDMASTDAAYSMDSLRSDLARLKELKRIEEIITASSRKEYNKSQLRQVQALTCMDILSEVHGFTTLGHGFDMNDAREAYVVRMRRHTDNAEVEIIVNHGSKDNEFEIYFRVDSSTYHDESVMADLRGQIQKDFEEAGITMVEYSGCTEETLEPFSADNIRISDQTRKFHRMSRRQTSSSI